jgi:hypothetical protein
LSCVSSVPHVLKVRCQYCSHFYHPLEVLNIGQGGVVMCWKCHEWHTANLLAAFQGGVPKGCFECKATWDELRLRLTIGDNPDEVKMFLVPKDGIYQLLCRTCSDAYEQKRADLLRGTLYGQTKGV